MSKILRWIAVVLPTLLVIRVSWFAWSKPERFSQLFMRSGAQIVKKMADHPARVAAFLGATVVLLWVLIVVRCAWEGWRERRNPHMDLPQTVAKG